jgi:hypothetical protein
MSPLQLPQTIALTPGEASYFYFATGMVWRNAHYATCQQPPQPLELGLLLALPILERLGKRLYKRYQAEERRVGKPAGNARPFRLSCEEVAVVTRYVLPAAGVFARPVLGKVQQKSLNLTPYLHF